MYIDGLLYVRYPASPEDTGMKKKGTVSDPFLTFGPTVP